jgi:apolipoprotein D and lipocalin family protein
MKSKKLISLLITIVVMAGFYSCSTIPKGIRAVKPFEKERYLGKWYEIARFDFRFERDLNNTTAEYSLYANGNIKVDNKGYNTKKGKWSQAIGTAKFVGNENIAMLEVSFFAPFYSGYNVIAIDPDYKYALVAGASLNYLWILSRETTIPVEIKNNYLKIAKDYGFNTSNLHWIDQNSQK